MTKEDDDNTKEDNRRAEFAAAVCALRLILAHINKRKESWAAALDDDNEENYQWVRVCAHLTDIAVKALIELHGVPIAAKLIETRLARTLDQPWRA